MFYDPHTNTSNNMSNQQQTEQTEQTEQTTNTEKVIQQYVWPNYKISGNIDNQLGTLHSNVMNALSYYNNKNNIFLEQHLSLPNVMIAKNVIDIDLAQRVRNFANNIPFTTEIPDLDDVKNQSKDIVHKMSVNKTDVKFAIQNRIENPNDWTWEKYSSDFFRALPLKP
jgi:hypothetical protein